MKKEEAIDYFLAGMKRKLLNYAEREYTGNISFQLNYKDGMINNMNVGINYLESNKEQRNGKERSS